LVVDLSSSFVVGISSRALFDLEEANRVFEEQGVEAYREYQLSREDELLEPGAAFPLVQALLRLNTLAAEGLKVEVVIMSHNSPDLSLRLFNSVKHYGLDITRAAFTAGKPLTPYLPAYSVDLFLSRSPSDVQTAVNADVAAAMICDPPKDFIPDQDSIRIAFDADAVIFSAESERIYQEQGLDAFVEHERANAKKPLPEGPFAMLLKTLSSLQSGFDKENRPVRIAIVTARNSPAHERVIRTLREWNVYVDEAFFMGGVSKDNILKAFRAHIFFDDQMKHLEKASKVVPSAQVPYRSQD
jgi:5'-nucleotidase